MTKKNEKMWGIEGTNENYELKQLLTHNMQLLEYNFIGNNDEGICNVYLEHHQSRWTSKVAKIPCTIVSQHPLITTPKSCGDKWIDNALWNSRQKVMFNNENKTSPTIIDQMPLEGLVKTNNFATPKSLTILLKIHPTIT